MANELMTSAEVEKALEESAKCVAEGLDITLDKFWDMVLSGESLFAFSNSEVDKVDGCR